MRTIPALAYVAVAALALAACGSDDARSPAATTSDGGPASTVSLKAVEGLGDVLVDAGGRALYTPDQEADGTIRCTDTCTSIWMPLSTGGGEPTASGDTGQLGVITRPDGTTQVTVGGRPLYTFAEDSAGAVTGDGLADSFGAQQFTWHAVLSGGATSDSAGTGGSPPGYGG